MNSETKEPVGKLVKMLSDAIGQKANKDFKACNLTIQQTRVISFLKEREALGQTTQKDIQNHLKVAHPTVVSILKGMENISEGNFYKKESCVTGFLFSQSGNLQRAPQSRKKTAFITVNRGKQAKIL